MAALRGYEESERILLDAHGGLRGSLGLSHQRTILARSRIVELYLAWGKPEKAEEYRALLGSAGEEPPKEQKPRNP